MKKSELMIGDWVQVPSLIDNVEGFNAWCKVKQLRDDDLDVVGFKELKYDEIEPIPITIEILEKNGFKLSSFGGEKEYISEDHRLLLDGSHELINSDNDWWVHVDTNDFRTIGSCEISYVHELQDFIRLCKIDQEIML